MKAGSSIGFHAFILLLLKHSGAVQIRALFFAAWGYRLEKGLSGPHVTINTNAPE